VTTRQWACEGACISGPWSGTYIKSDVLEVALLNGCYEYCFEQSGWIWVQEFPGDPK
jgi:hypothetical protein